jgi:DNA-binding MarR family transcriptional regulator
VESTSNTVQQVSELDKHLGYLLRRVSNAVSAEFAGALQAKQTSVAEWVLMRNLYDRDNAAPADLAKSLTMTRGAISKIIDKLEAKGWIRSKVNPEDHRGLCLTLTALGRRTVPELARIADSNDESFFGCLDNSESATLRRLLGKIAMYREMRDVPVD